MCNLLNKIATQAEKTELGSSNFSYRRTYPSPCVQCRKRVGTCSHGFQGVFAGEPEDALDAGEAEKPDNILSEATGDVLGDAQVATLLEADVVVDVNDLTGHQVDKQVVQVPDKFAKKNKLH